MHFSMQTDLWTVISCQRGVGVCAREMCLVDECSRCDAIFQRQLEFVSPICQENEQKLSLIRYTLPPVTRLSIWVILIPIKGLCTLSQCFADGASKVVDVCRRAHDWYYYATLGVACIYVVYMLLVQLVFFCRAVFTSLDWIDYWWTMLIYDSFAATITSLKPLLTHCKS